MKINSIHTTLPSPDLPAPRDGYELKDTTDVLFLSHILWKAAKDDMLEHYSRDENEHLYLLRGKSEQTRNPVSGNAADIPTGFKHVKNIKISKVRTYLRKGFYGYRHLLERLYGLDGYSVSYNIVINGMEVYTTARKERYTVQYIIDHPPHRWCLLL